MTHSPVRLRRLAVPTSVVTDGATMPFDPASDARKGDI
jgi:hypothetical protein